MRAKSRSRSRERLHSNQRSRVQTNSFKNGRDFKSIKSTNNLQRGFRRKSPNGGFTSTRANRGSFDHRRVQSDRPKLWNARKFHKSSRVIDRNTSCPFLLQVYYKCGEPFTLKDFEEKSEELTSSELQIYAWKNGTLRELTDLLKDVCEESRDRNVFLEFAIVRRAPNDQLEMKNFGKIHSTRPGLEDRRTLAEVQFEIGDRLSLVIKRNRRQRSGGSEEMQKDGEDPVGFGEPHEDMDAEKAEIQAEIQAEEEMEADESKSERSQDESAVGGKIESEEKVLEVENKEDEEADMNQNNESKDQLEDDTA